MSEQMFYSTKGKKNQRKLRILSAALLVGKAPTNEKRINIKVRMQISGDPADGAPEWLDNARVFVAQNHDTVVPAVEFTGYNLQFSARNLFGPKAIKAKYGRLSHFKIAEFGDGENPDVVTEFAMRIPFATSAWDWLGQYGGEDVWVKFIPGEPEKAEGGADDPDMFEDDASNED